MCAGKTRRPIGSRSTPLPREILGGRSSAMRRSKQHVAVVMFLVAITGCGRNRRPVLRLLLGRSWKVSGAARSRSSGRVSRRRPGPRHRPSRHAGHESAVVQRTHPIAARISADHRHSIEPDHARQYAAGPHQHAGDVSVAARLHGKPAECRYRRTRTIDADFSGVDCPSLQRPTFTGRVQLTKSGS